MGSSLNKEVKVENTFETSITEQPSLVGENMQAGVITEVSENDQVTINGLISAKKALSCLITPQKGDLVLYWSDNECAWIISVLHGAARDKREMSLPDNQALTLNTQTLTVNASDAIRLNAIKEININVALGKLNQCARSVYQMVHGSMVQLTKHMISKSEYLDFHAEKLLKSHATQQLITAEKDIKMDADRINMG